MKLNKHLTLFLTCHFLVWSILPIILRPNLPMDSAEALIWGFIGEWGTNKHPPMSGFFADIIYRITGHPASLYVLSQMFIVGGLIYIYNVARLFLPKNKALIATFILEGVAYYSLVTPEYNVNIIALLLWPAATYHFYRSINYDTLHDWVLFGFFAGLNILNKYVSGILLICFASYLLFTKEGRLSFKSWKLYFAGLIGLIVVIPHLAWLHQNDYFVVDYFLGRSGGGKSLPYGLSHIVYPLKFVAAQLMTASFAIIALSIAHRFSPRQPIAVVKSDRVFIFFCGVLPLLIMALISLVLGIKLKSMWGSPVMYMLGICFFTWLPFDVEKSFKPLLKTCWAALVLFSCAFALQVILTTSAKFKLDAKDFITHVKARDFEYVGGSVWLASTVGVYAPNHPNVLFLMSPKTNPWINMEDLNKKGMLVVEENLNVYKNYQKTFAKLTEPEVYLLTVKSPTGKIKEHKLYYGTIAGEQK